MIMNTYSLDLFTKSQGLPTESFCYTLHAHCGPCSWSPFMFLHSMFTSAWSLNYFHIVGSSNSLARLATAMCVRIAFLLVTMVHCLFELAAALSGQLSTTTYELAPSTLYLEHSLHTRAKHHEHNVISRMLAKCSWGCIVVHIYTQGTGQA